VDSHVIVLFVSGNGSIVSPPGCTWAATGDRT
jgi:hypothetical protein